MLFLRLLLIKSNYWIAHLELDNIMVNTASGKQNKCADALDNMILCFMKPLQPMYG